MADTMGRKSIMRPALFVGFAITTVSSFSPNFESLMVLRFLTGCALAAPASIAYSYLGEFHDQKYRNRAILSASFITAFLVIFFPIYAWAFINMKWKMYIPILNIMYKPWRLYIMVCGFTGLMCGIGLTFLPESPKYLLAKGKPENAIEVLKYMHHVNTKHFKALSKVEFKIGKLLSEDYVMPNKSLDGKNFVIRFLISMWQQTSLLFMREHLRKTFICCLLQFVIFFTAYGILMWFPYILNTITQYKKHHSEPKTLCEILSYRPHSNSSFTEIHTSVCIQHLEISTFHHSIALETIAAILLLINSYAIGKLGSKTILFLILVVSGTSGLLAFLIKVPIIAIYAFALELCCSLAVSVVNAIIVDIYPTSIRTIAISIAMMMGRISSISASYIFGLLYSTSCNLILLSSAAALIFAGFLSLFLPQSIVVQKSPKNLIN
ncbi:synaptic vesicle glycoprotein 2B-like [Teleopsis dalmanni]|uniref:synaptic vesicle glycoprotein 2B-like n=1 Tax=Teleopsis dalmanni TaxID=139649 RepID=UPI0018CDB104|nr:synaptic vesicle glycoprotein 2B-like [Teleopsis dalmanni]